MEQLRSQEMAIYKEVEALRDINRMVYIMPSQAGIMELRTYKTYTFNNQTCMPGDTILLNGNSGSDFIWAPNSYLRLQWTVTSTDAAVQNITFGYGSIMNLIQEIRIIHSSGEVLEYIQNINLAASNRTRWETSYDDQIKLNALLGGVDTSAPLVGSALGGGFVFGGVIDPLDLSTQSTVYVPAGGSSTFVSLIPMSYLSGIFSRTDQYIPPGLLAGSTIQLILNNAATTYFPSAGTIAISNIRPTILYDSAKAYDAATRAILNEQSSESGLQYVYSTLFNTYTNSATSAINFDIQQSASITEKIWAVFRVIAPPVGPITGANLCTFTPQVSQYQFRIASDFKPQQPVVIPPAVGVVAAQSAEAYMQTLQTFETGLHSYATPVGNGASVSLAEFNTYAAVYGTTLERTACGLSLTGVPTNNASLLNINANIGGVNTRCDVFLQYVRVANLRGSGCIVDR
jgi:hypothetical protein